MNQVLSSFSALSYKHVLKRFFFLFDAEAVHNAMTDAGVFFGKSSIARNLAKSLWAYNSPTLVKTFDGVRFPNPVGLSAGFDYNGNLTQILPAVGFGFHTIGTVTLQPYLGNPTPRLGRFPKSKALLVNKGLKNEGAVEIIKKLTGMQFSIPTGISIASTNTHFDSEKEQIEDIIECFKLFEKSKVKHAYYEFNISCPNTFGGEPFTTPEKLERALRELDKLKITRPTYIKFPIDQSEKETVALLDVIAEHNIQGIITGNLTKDKTNPDIDPADREEWKVKRGNLSGKPTWRRSTAIIEIIRKKYGKRFTIIGTGGVFSGKDAQEKMDKGADLVQLITGMIFEGPQVIGQINRDLDTHK